jgi:hypothetical protein
MRTSLATRWPASSLAPSLVVIPCGSSKLPHRAPARELYVGAYFRACLRYAELRAPRGLGAILVLSARHGLVRLTDELSPYELRMGQPGSVTPDILLVQARSFGMLYSPRVEVLGGQAYIAAARRVWPEAVAPVPRVGIGRQLAWLRARRLQLLADEAALREQLVLDDGDAS